MDNINDLLKNMDKAKMVEYLKIAKQFAATPEGKKTIDELKKTGKSGDKNISEITKAISDNPELAEKLKELF